MPTSKKYITHLITFIFLTLLLCLILFFSYKYGAEGLIEIIGVHNGYIIASVSAFFGGFSALTSFTYYGVIITLVTGGLNPFLLALVAGLSLSLGDSLMFYFGRKGRDIITGRLDRNITKLANYLENKQKLKPFIPFFAWLYIGLLPLPNDWLLLFLAIIKYPSKKMLPIIIAGDLTFALALCLLAN